MLERRKKILISLLLCQSKNTRNDICCIYTLTCIVSRRILTNSIVCYKILSLHILESPHPCTSVILHASVTTCTASVANITNTPLKLGIVDVLNSQLGHKLSTLRRRENFGQHICQLILCW
ncbi:Homeobox protein HD-2 [Bienertia sinuspersici]